MSATVSLTFAEENSGEKALVFDHRLVCLVGRAKDCYLQLPSDMAHLDVSRHHCLLDVDPPHVRVCDVGSRNGTYVNGLRLRPPGAPDADGKPGDVELAEYDLADGDELRVGGTVFHVAIADEEQGRKVRRTDGLQVVA